jgi:hypothetical protein
MTPHPKYQPLLRALEFRAQTAHQHRKREEKNRIAGSVETTHKKLIDRYPKIVERVRKEDGYQLAL